ncbi:MAG: dUTP diphosphatase [Neomegalonema sp.]|nr:dUTP diphosphatase [Neomegalonema sp.]
MSIPVQLQLLPHAAQPPSYETEGAAGADLAAANPADAPIEIPPGARALVSTGLMIALPVGYEAQIRPRSGLAARRGVTVLNAPGTIDADYRGEIKVLLINLGDQTARIDRGDRIAQMVIAPAPQATFTPVAELPQTIRGAGGFGSTGGAS